LVNFYNKTSGIEDFNDEVKEKVGALSKELEFLWKYLTNWLADRKLLELP
jgi:hypothetical protein